LLEKSYNYEELVYLWKAWRDATGRKIKSNYLKYLELSNLEAKLNGTQKSLFASLTYLLACGY